MNSRQMRHLNLKSVKTRFTLRFLRALKKINRQKKITNGFMMTHRVRLAADASMASAVGPMRAWSRALLLRIRPKSLCRAHMHGLVRRGIVRRRQQQEARVQAQAQNQAEELRRLVPGGQAMDFQSLLDETAHYIKCLTTQVMVMRSIVNYCSTF